MVSCKISRPEHGSHRRIATVGRDEVLGHTNVVNGSCTCAGTANSSHVTAATRWLTVPRRTVRTPRPMNARERAIAGKLRLPRRAKMSFGLVVHDTPVTPLKHPNMMSLNGRRPLSPPPPTPKKHTPARQDLRPRSTLETAAPSELPAWPVLARTALPAGSAPPKHRERQRIVLQAGKLGVAQRGFW